MIFKKLWQKNENTANHKALTATLPSTLDINFNKQQLITLMTSLLISKFKGDYGKILEFLNNANRSKQ